jgi:hypothetical protein
MKSRFVLVLVLPLLALAGCKKSAGKDISQWKELSAQDGDFKVIMPPDPKRQTQPATIPGGGTVNGTVYEASGTDWSFLAGWVDLGASRGYDFEAGMNSTAQQFDGKVTEKENIVVNGYSGVEFTMSINKPVKGTAVERIIYVNLPEKNINRVYLLMGAGTKIAKSDATVRKLFDSFEMKLPKGPN